MIITAIENFVLFSTVFAGAAFVYAATMHTLNARGVIRRNPERLSRFYTRALVVPPIVSAWLVTAALLPQWFLSANNFNADHGAPLHDLHLWTNITATMEPLISYLTLAFVLVTAGFCILSSWRMRLHLGRLIGRLELIAEQPSDEQIAVVRESAAQHSMDVGLVMSSYPFSFVWGFVRSKLVLSTALLRMLTAEELRGVIEHEAAHHRRRDNLAKLFLSLAAGSSLAFPLSRLILQWRASEVEVVCDDLAVARTRKPLEIAEALVKIRRDELRGEMLESIVLSGFSSDNPSHFERRVERLIDVADIPDFPGSHRNIKNQLIRSVVCAALFTLTLAALTIVSPLAVHRAAETAINLIR